MTTAGAMSPLSPPKRLLLGPGPSEVAPEVYAAMSKPVLGHLDPAFLAIMDETSEALRRVFVTKNRMTIPISGTGSAGMEAAVVNVLEPGDRVVIGICGYFGGRLAEMARRCGAEVVTVEAPWGTVIDAGAIEAALKSGRTKAVALVHGETSTGALQPLEEIVRIAHQHGALVIADAVTSLGGVPVDVDARGIDVCYSGSQKCLGAPPGLAPITVSDRAMEMVRSRKTKVRCWYLDLTGLETYWGGDHAYHHTLSASMVYALREALRLVLEEGLPARHRRHMEVHRALADGVQRMGLDLYVAPEIRLPQLTTIRVPEGVDANVVKKRLLDEDGIEISGGFGPLAGKIWRVGLMGHGARIENVERLVAALKRILSR